MKTKVSNVILGVIFLLVGIGFLGNVLNLWQFELFFDGWWTLFIIIPCIYSMIDHGVNWGNVIGVIVGASLLLSAQDIISFNLMFKIMIPALFILLGIRIIFTGFGKTMPVIDTTNAMNLSTCFGGNEYVYPNVPFRGANCSAVFGGVSLDLRGAIIDQDVCIQCNAIFGGVDILLPPNVRIDVRSTPIFGGVENKHYTQGTESSPLILIKAVCTFGGVEIR